nr:uncharacterized protein LOC127328690 [Lolium perenne]
MVGGGGAGSASDGTEGGVAVALEGGGGARPMRLIAFVLTLAGTAPLGPTVLVFILPPFLEADGASAGGVAAGEAAAAAGASKNCFGILFLFDGMVAQIMADTAPAFGGPLTGTSTTAAEGGAPPAVGGPCGGSMAAGSGRLVTGKGGVEEIGRRRLASAKPFARSGGEDTGLTLYPRSHPTQVGGEGPPRNRNQQKSERGPFLRGLLDGRI